MDPRARSSTVDPRTSLALWLRAGRAQRNLTLDDVARVTKIQARILEKLETGQLEGLPAEVFVRGFVKSFARCVGLDESEAGERYGACAAVASSPAIPAARAFVETLVAAPPRERAQKQIAAPPAPAIEPVVAPIAEIAPAVEIAPIEVAPIIQAAPVVEAAPIVVETAPIEKKKRTRKSKASTTTTRSRKKKQPVAAQADGADAAPAPAIEPPNDIVRDARPDLENATAEIEAKANVDREPSASSNELAASNDDLAASSNDLAASSNNVAASSNTVASSDDLAASSDDLAASSSDITTSNIAPSNIAPSNIAPSNIAPSNIAPSNTAPSNTANGSNAASNWSGELAMSSGELATTDATMTTHAIEVIDQSAPLPIDELALADGSEPISTFDEPTQIWQPTMPPPTTTATVPWKRPTSRVSTFSAPILVIDDADPEQADQERDEREAAAKAPHRVSFLPPILLDRDDKSTRQGGLTLAVIILLIAATLTLSYLMRHPSASGDGVTMLDTHTFVA